MRKIGERKGTSRTDIDFQEDQEHHVEHYGAISDSLYVKDFVTSEDRKRRENIGVLVLGRSGSQ